MPDLSLDILKSGMKKKKKMDLKQQNSTAVNKSSNNFSSFCNFKKFPKHL